MHAHGAGLAALSEGADIAAHPSGGPPLRREFRLHRSATNIRLLTGENNKTFYYLICTVNNVLSILWRHNPKNHDSGQLRIHTRVFAPETIYAMLIPAIHTWRKRAHTETRLNFYIFCYHTKAWYFVKLQHTREQMESTVIWTPNKIYILCLLKCGGKHLKSTKAIIIAPKNKLRKLHDLSIRFCHFGYRQLTNLTMFFCLLPLDLSHWVQQVVS